MRPVNRLDCLVEPFLSIYLDVLNECEEEGVFIKVFETLRPLQRQQELYAQGRTKPGAIITNAKPGDSAHNYGLGADAVLDVARVKVRRRPWNGKMVLDAWDTETPEAAKMWERYGLIVEKHGLIWGGRFKNVPDHPHCEHPEWRLHRPADWRQRVADVVRPS